MKLKRINYLFKFILFHNFFLCMRSPFNRQREKYRQQYLPWALSVGKNMTPLMNVYWEQRWHQKIDDLRKELHIEPFDVKWKKVHLETKPKQNKKT